jgi:molybdopterin molybdotransferase
MIAVEEARRRILAAMAPLPAEEVAVSEALGRVLAEPLAARVTQPPAAVSAMDGYAVRAADVAQVPARLRVVATVPAGRPSPSRIGPGEAARIFTGGVLPEGADAVVIQEDATPEPDHVPAHVVVREGAMPGAFVRPAGLDFRSGEVGLAPGRRLTARDVGLAAAMNHAWIKVHRRPRVAILSTGDELVRPGGTPGPGQIVGSNGVALAAFVRAEGGQPVQLGIVADDRAALAEMASAAEGVDLLVTSGGASVGDHDLIAAALGEAGMALDFWKIAMRPGKPLLFGRLGSTPVLGLPGNPVSSLVCALVFLRPALAVLQGQHEIRGEEAARLACDVPGNDRRQDYLRSRLRPDPAGGWLAEPFARQDSSMLSLLAAAGCLVIRPPQAPPAPTGTLVPILRLDGLL